MSEVEKQDSTLEIKRAAQLSVTEVGLGSVGHGFKIPLTGQILSLNQLGFLLNAVNSDKLPKAAVFEISSIAAILKSFSPAGKKLGPMLSIAMQGFLFWISLVFVGSNLVGQIVGAILLSCWAFVQPLITLFFIYGFDLLKLAEFYATRMQEDYAFMAVALVYAMGAVFVIKMSLAVVITVLSLKFKKQIKIIDDEKLKIKSALKRDEKIKSPVKGALKDLFRPIFLLSFILMMVFVWQLNGSLSEKIWLSLRPLALGFLIFYLLRSPWVAQKLLDYAQKSPRFKKIHEKTGQAWQLIQNKQVNQKND